MIFSVLEELRFKDVFSDLSLFSGDEEIDYIDVLIEHSTRTSTFVYDSEVEGHSIFIEDTSGIGNNKIFIIKNPNRKDFFLMHIDGVLFDKNSKCDCAIITDKELDFIEFKSNAINRTDEAIESNYEKASSQLLNTLTEFRRRYEAIGDSLDGKKKLECYAVFNKTVPRNPAYQKKLSASFLKNSNGVKLKFENSKIIR